MSARQRAATLSDADLGALVRAGRVRGPAATLARLAKTAVPRVRGHVPAPRSDALTVTWSGGKVTLSWPMRLYSEANQRDTWEHVRRKKMQRGATSTFVSCCVARFAPPFTITITRVGKRLLDDDNLHGACKHVRDGIADAFGVDDGDARYTWRVEQRIGDAYQVEVRIAERF